MLWASWVPAKAVFPILGEGRPCFPPRPLSCLLLPLIMPLCGPCTSWPSGMCSSRSSLEGWISSLWEPGYTGYPIARLHGQDSQMLPRSTLRSLWALSLCHRPAPWPHLGKASPLPTSEASVHRTLAAHLQKGCFLPVLQGTVKLLFPLLCANESSVPPDLIATPSPTSCSCLGWEAMGEHSS